VIQNCRVSDKFVLERETGFGEQAELFRIHHELLSNNEQSFAAAGDFSQGTGDGSPVSEKNPRRLFTWGDGVNMFRV